MSLGSERLEFKEENDAMIIDRKGSWKGCDWVKEQEMKVLVSFGGLAAQVAEQSRRRNSQASHGRNLRVPHFGSW
jgi:hypothetical protein